MYEVQYTSKYISCTKDRMPASQSLLSFSLLHLLLFCMSIRATGIFTRTILNENVFSGVECAKHLYGSQLTPKN